VEKPQYRKISRNRYIHRRAFRSFWLENVATKLQEGDMPGKSPCGISPLVMKMFFADL